jgi:hypothetical protein
MSVFTARRSEQADTARAAPQFEHLTGLSLTDKAGSKPGQKHACSIKLIAVFMLQQQKAVAPQIFRHDVFASDINH